MQLYVQFQLESSQFSTTPLGSDALINIIWEIKNNTLDTTVEEFAGTANPFRPSLNTNTSYTVRVKHQGLNLGESDYSTSSVTFQTGGTRNLYTYYKERVEQLESRLASIESDEVNDDATDTALLTLIAGFAARIQALEESN